jgi:hypothetical protein
MPASASHTVCSRASVPSARKASTVDETQRVLPTWAPSRIAFKSLMFRTPDAGDEVTATTAWLTSTYGEEKSTAALRCSVIENWDRLASKVFGPAVMASLNGTRTQRTSPAAKPKLAATA